MEKAVHPAEQSSVHRYAVDSLPPETTLGQSAPPGANTLSPAKRYANIKLTLGLTGTLAWFLLSLLLLASGATRVLDEFVRSYLSNAYTAFLGFAAILGLGEMLLTLPLQFYSGYILEHKYSLSNQSVWGWMKEGLKGLLVSIPIAIPLLLVFMYCLRTFGQLWWLPVASVLFFFSVILARLGPVLLFPIFYKFKPLQEGELKSAILRLCQTVGMSVQGVFVFDMSKNTKKANAAFTGIGRSRRIILGDTLVANFRDDEIETIFAHELGHYKLKHVLSMMTIGTISSFLGLFLTAAFYGMSLPWFGFDAIDQLAALPLLALWLGGYSLVSGPLSNLISRAHERAADRYAVQLTGKGEAFSNALKKLATINLADVSPHPVVEFLFHSHPSIEKRIRAVELLAVGTRNGALG